MRCDSINARRCAVLLLAVNLRYGAVQYVVFGICGVSAASVYE